MGKKQKNVTFSLPEDLVEKLRTYAKEKYISSINTGVKEALEEYTAKIEKLKLREEMKLASRDPLFLKDIDEAQYDFRKVDEESSGGSEEW